MFSRGILRGLARSHQMYSSQFLLPDSRLFVPDSRCFTPCSPVVVSALSSLSDCWDLVASRVFLDLHALVFVSRVYNFEGLRLPAPSSLRTPVWRSYLREYADYAVCEFLEFGWPVGFDSLFLSTSCPANVLIRNHKGALDFPDLSLENGRQAVISSFAHNPFSCPVAVSALNSVPKPNGRKNYSRTENYS